MAQIVTITNPLTGQPAQVDQLEHTAQEIDDAIARALPGGAIDITLSALKPWTLINSATKTVDTSDTEFGEFRHVVVPSNINTFEAFRIDIKANSSGLKLKRVRGGVSGADCMLFGQNQNYYLEFDKFPDRTISFVITPVSYITGSTTNMLNYVIVSNPSVTTGTTAQTASFITQNFNTNPATIYGYIYIALIESSGSCTVSLYGR